MAYENWAMPLKCKRCGKLFGNFEQMLEHFGKNKACGKRYRYKERKTKLRPPKEKK